MQEALATNAADSGRWVAGGSPHTRFASARRPVSPGIDGAHTVNILRTGGIVWQKASSMTAGSFFDRYTLTQWGFYYTSTCEVLTDKGTIVVR